MCIISHISPIRVIYQYKFILAQCINGAYSIYCHFGGIPVTLFMNSSFKLMGLIYKWIVVSAIFRDRFLWSMHLIAVCTVYIYIFRQILKKIFLTTFSLAIWKKELRAWSIVIIWKETRTTQINITMWHKSTWYLQHW